MMLTLYSIFLKTYHAQDYAGIIGLAIAICMQCHYGS